MRCGIGVRVVATKCRFLALTVLGRTTGATRVHRLSEMSSEASGSNMRLGLFAICDRLDQPWASDC
jgi:hypothetical protein